MTGELEQQHEDRDQDEGDDQGETEQRPIFRSLLPPGFWNKLSNSTRDLAAYLTAAPAGFFLDELAPVHHILSDTPALEVGGVTGVLAVGGCYVWDAATPVRSRRKRAKGFIRKLGQEDHDDLAEQVRREIDILEAGHDYKAFDRQMKKIAAEYRDR